MSALNVWMGNWGQYPIPDEVFALVKRLTKSGYPDKRYAGCPEFFAWVAEQEKKAQAN